MIMLKKTHRRLLGEALAEQRERADLELAERAGEIIEAAATHRREVMLLRQDAVALRNEVAALKGQLVAAAHAANQPAHRFDP